MSINNNPHAPLTDEERARRNVRYMWDNRRKTNDPETEGYGYHFDQMFRDLEAAEAAKRTPNASLPRLNPDGPHRKMCVYVEVSANFETRLDNQWEVEREINADRWSWGWANER